MSRSTKSFCLGDGKWYFCFSGIYLWLISNFFYVLTLLCFSCNTILSGLAVVYTLRVNISVAAQKMRDELEWSESQKGLVLVSSSS